MRDQWRLVLVLVASLVAGMIVGHVPATVSVGLLLYILWFQKRLHRLLGRLHDRDLGNDDGYDGALGEILREFERARRHHQDRGRLLISQLKRFQVAASAIPDAVILLGRYGRIEWANSKAGEYLGIDWPRDDGQRISNLLRDPGLGDLLQSNGAIDADEHIELTLLMNQERHLELRIIPYGNDQRLLVARDITEIHQTNNMRKDFIANASHELRTPLTVIAGYLESIENDDDDTRVSSWKSIIGKMRSHTVRMQRLIDDLLKLSTLESVRAERQRDEVMVTELLSSIFNEAKTLSGDLGHIFYLETNPDLWLLGHQQELYSAFSNLVFNAVQYTPAKGVIRVKWYETDDGACMEVTDSGEGIASEHIPRLTERFYRVDKGRSRDRGGTGLGLAIVKHILKNHQATLEISSVIGKGSTFRCLFPNNHIIWKHSDDETSLSA